MTDPPDMPWTGADGSPPPARCVGGSHVAARIDIETRPFPHRINQMI